MSVLKGYFGQGGTYLVEGCLHATLAKTVLIQVSVLIRAWTYGVM